MTTMDNVLPMKAFAPANEREELIDGLTTGRLRFHQLPRHFSALERAEIRRAALERRRKVDLGHMGHFSFDAERASRQNCENLVGVAQIPTGIIGPLKLHGEYVVDDEEIFVPLATTEGALIASTNRGCRAIREAGGAVVRADNVGITRGPVFRTSGLVESRDFVRWIEEHKDEIRERAKNGSKFLRMLDVGAKAIGTNVFLRFRFDAGDAMGMNMATIAVDRVIEEYIEPETGVECVALSGNYCVDKKPAAINFLEGRGKRIHAEVVLDRNVLSKCLKTTARALVEVQYRKILMGSTASVALGFNAHYANILAALFIATGQDLAQVVEGSLGVTTVESCGPETVIVSVYLPDVPLAAIGGGTGLQTQQEALALLGVEPDPERPGAAVMRLAEIVGGAVLAGELSLLAALTSRDLARAHQKLGRSCAPQLP